MFDIDIGQKVNALCKRAEDKLFPRTDDLDQHNHQGTGSWFEVENHHVQSGEVDQCIDRKSSLSKRFEGKLFGILYFENDRITLPHILIGASNSRSVGSCRKIFFDFSHRILISSSDI